MTDLFGHRPTIKALSIWQPWASLVAAGVKRHETRHRATSYRGPVAIHAAKTIDDEYRAALEALGLSINAAGRLLGVSEKTGKNYAKDGPSPPAGRLLRVLLFLTPAMRAKAVQMLLEGKGLNKTERMG